MDAAINFTTEIWRNGGHFVAWAPELDVSSMGNTIDEARKNLREAMGLFVDEAEHMGTLRDILEESGYVRSVEGWRAPEILAIEKMSVAVS
ncbi:hypothetical protein A3F52_04690 [Candidatus Uhrbacteria bacterium RIFCSPHIGHO2_12_FULL_47_11]|nr:MAG: hypothetical protein A3F52_04690 [Candidatus Uhrbacteria bacterium RIFCSPHIGHO2_12_FULL_47_11]